MGQLREIPIRKVVQNENQRCVCDASRGRYQAEERIFTI